jgi:hypothetical protein
VDNRLAISAPPVDDNEAITNHPGYIFVTMLASNINAKLNVHTRLEQQAQEKLVFCLLM